MIIIDSDELQAKIRNGEIEAVCVDTSVYESQHFAFHKRLLSEMKNLQAAGIRVLMPDVIEREILSHLTEKLPEIHSNLRKSMRAASNFGLVSENAEGELQVIEENPQKLAEDRLLQHQKATETTTLSVGDYASVGEVFDSYFEIRAPFELKKKSEFPDAFALNALENWAKSEGTQVMVFSNDEGWANFANGNGYVHAGPKLSDLLVAIQAADPFLLTKAIAAIKGSQIDKITSHLNDNISGMAINADVHSYHYAEAEVTDSNVLSIDLDGLEENDLEIVRSDGHEFVVRWTIHALVHFEANVELSMYDSVDKDYVNLGIEEVSQDTQLELESLVTFRIEKGNGSVELEFDGLEITDNSIEVDFGEVEVSYGPED